MPLSSGTRTLLGEALSWVAAAAILAAGLTHYSELKALTAHAVGLELELRDATPSAAPTRPANTRNVELRAAANGHFYSRASINGRDVDILVDTGATIVALTWEDAQRAGLSLRPSDFTASVSTANGTARVAPVRLDRVEIGGILVRDVDATVSDLGRLKTTLLGMSFLSRLKRVDMRQGVLVLAE